MAAFLAIEPAWLTHPKVQGVHRDARSLWVAAGLHAVATETDGRVEKRMIPLLAAQAGVSPKRAAELVTAGLWIEKANHYEIHDFLKYNQSKALREAQREKWRKAKAKAAGIPAESNGDTNGSSATTPGASLPGPALPTDKPLFSSIEIPPRNGHDPTPPNQPTDEGRDEIAKIKAAFRNSGFVVAEDSP